MRILLVWDISKPLKELFDLSNIKLRSSDKLAVILPAESTRVIIDKDNIIKYEIKCIFTEKDKRIPQITPKDIDDLNIFLKEFNADLIHSFDTDVLGLITQNWAINNKIHYLLSKKDLSPIKFNKKHIEYINDENPLRIEDYIKYNNIKQTKRWPANLFWLIIAIIGALLAFLKLNIKKNLNEKPKQ